MRQTTPHLQAKASMLNRISLAARLSLAFGSLVALVLVLAVWLWVAMGQIHHSVNIDVREQTMQALQAKDMQRNVVQVQQFLSDISATRGLDGLDDGFKEAENNKHEFLKGLEALNQHATAMHDDTLLASLPPLQQAFSDYYATGVKMAQAYVAGGPEQGNPLMGGFDKTSEALQEQMDQVVEHAQTALQHVSDKVAAQTQRMRTLALLVPMAIAGAALLLGWRIAHSIVVPLALAAQALDRMAHNDLAFDLSFDGQDEAGAMVSTLNLMKQRLTQVVSNVHSNAEHVAQSSREISAGTHDLSHRTESQASALSETAASTAQLSDLVLHNANRASEASQLTQKACTVATKAGQVVGNMVSTMDGINQSSRKISDIIGVIDSIAFQTNILALNAAVEAARAGEQGRGFAVVANEVRNLAGRSATAAKEIKELITESVRRVDTGTQLVKSVGSTIAETVASIGQVNAIMTGMTTTTKDEHLSIQEIDKAIKLLDGVTQENVALVEQSTVALESLKDQAQVLLEMSSVFRLQPAA